MSSHEIEEAAETLWNQLLSARQFYAFEFFRNRTIEDLLLHFYCPEVRFGLCIEHRPSVNEIKTRKARVKKLEDSGYKIMTLSCREIQEEYPQVVDLLDREFTSLTRFQCG